MEKGTNYYYKTASLTPKDDWERKLFEITNDYGYNFDSMKRRNINQEDLCLKPKNIVNKDFIGRNK